MTPRRPRLSAASLLLMLLAVLTVLPSCRKNEFTLTLKLPKNSMGTYTMLYYASDPKKGWIVETVLVPKDGALETKGMTRNPSLVFIFDRAADPAAFFYVRRGDRMVAEGSAPVPSTWMITGNSVSEQISEWRVKHRGALKSGDPKKINAAVAELVKAEPSRPSTALVLYVCFDREIDPGGFKKLEGMLSGDAADSEWLDLVSPGDMAGGEPMLPKAPQTVVLNSLLNGVDTIRFGRVPALLYFGRKNAEGQDGNIAGLKAAKAQQQQAMNTFEYTLLSAASEVSNALTVYEKSQEKGVWLDKQVEDLTKAVEMTQALFTYSTGDVNYLNVITAQQSLLAAQISRISCAQAGNLAVINLYQSMGGGR